MIFLILDSEEVSVGGRRATVELIVLLEAIESVEPVLEERAGHVVGYNDGQAKVIGSTITMSNGHQLRVSEKPAAVLAKMADATKRVAL